MLDEGDGSFEVVDLGGFLDPVEINSFEGDVRYVGAHLFINNPKVLHSLFEIFWPNPKLEGRNGINMLKWKKEVLGMG